MANTPQISPPFLCSASRNRRDLMVPRYQKFVVPWKPLALPGLDFWYDASQITGLSDGAEITSWPDLSGNSNHATNASSASGPTYKTSILNGKPVARFNGTSNYLTLGTNYTGGDGAYCFVVTNYTGTTGVYAGLFVAQKIGVYARFDNNDEWGAYTSNQLLSGVVLDSSCKLLSAIFNSTSSVDLYTNGGSVANTSGSGYQSRTASAIGADPSGAQFHNGDIAELFGGVGTITTDILTAANDYISDKYAIF